MNITVITMEAVEATTEEAVEKEVVETAEEEAVETSAWPSAPDLSSGSVVVGMCPPAWAPSPVERRWRCRGTMTIALSVRT